MDSRTLNFAEISTRRSRNTGLEAFSAMHLNADGNPFYGVETGIGMILREQKRVRLHAGVSYGYYNIDGLGFFGIGNTADAETLGNQGYPDPLTGVTYDLNEVYANSLEVEEAQQLTEKFHYLHVPISMEYRITPRISVGAGVKAGVLLSAPARYRLNDVRFASSGIGSSSKDFLYDYDILRKFDIAPMLSIEFMISKSLSLQAGYTHGLIHYINNSGTSDRSDFHRTASLGLRYRIL
jgi:hypothetical protein